MGASNLKKIQLPIDLSFIGVNHSSLRKIDRKIEKF